MNIALLLSSDSIALAHRQKAGHWAIVGETALDVPDLDGALSGLRSLAVEREGEDFSTLLVLPDDQILYTSLTAPTGDDELTAFRIEEGLDGLTPYAITELEYDWREVEQDRVKIAVVARETLEEARGFASNYGFTSVGFLAMPPTERFPGMPVFGADDADTLPISDEGLAFGMDTYGMPEPEPEPEAAAEAAPEAKAEPDAAADKAPEPEDAPEIEQPVAEEPESASEPEPSVALEPETGPEPEPNAVPEASADPEPAADTEPQRSVPENATADDAPDDTNPALAEALALAAAAPIDPAPDITPDPPTLADPSLTAPVAPLQDETPALSDDDLPELPPAPSPASAEAKRRARVLRGDAPGPVTSSETHADRTGLTASRDSVSASDPDPAPTPRFSREVERPAAAGPIPNGNDTPPLTAEPGAAPPPKLAEQLQRVRAASKTRPKGAEGVSPPMSRPRVEIPPRDADGMTGATAERRPSPFDEPPADASDGRGGLAGLLSGRRKAKANAAQAKPTAKRTPQATARVAPEQSNRANRPALFTRDTGAAVPAVAGAPTAPEDETFSSGLLARKSTSSSGPSFRTGLILTVILLVLLALVAIWSAVFLPDSPVARLFGLGSDREPVAEAPGLNPNAPDVSSAAPRFGFGDDPNAAQEPSLEDEAAADGIDLVDEGLLVIEGGDGATETRDVASAVPLTTAPDGTLDVPATATTPTVEAELPDIDADLDLPPLPPLPQDALPSVEEAEALYAEDGIWTRTPNRPDLRPFDLLDRVYTAAIDPDIQSLDAVALPDPEVNPGELLRRFPPPPAFGSEFALTDNGLVAATPDGVLTPEGAFVVAGSPPVAAVQRPREVVTEAPVIDTDAAILGTFRPTQRPQDLSEIRERQVLNGFTNDELGARRPEARPQSPQEAAARASLFPGATDAAVEAALAADIEAETNGGAPAAVTGGTNLAVANSQFPRTRPGNIAQIVASADRTPLEPPTAVAVAAVAPGPSIPSNADVSRAATERNAIRLRNVNLLGVAGSPTDRRALVRLASGRIVRVSVGDRLDGGRVAAIGETTLQYLRNGRTVTLEIPG